MNHQKLKEKVIIEANKHPSVKLWPNPVGTAYAGKNVNSFNEKNKRYVVLENYRPIPFGLIKGSCDLIGFVQKSIHSINIPVFLAVEIKLMNDTVKPDQKRYIEMVNSFGGCAGVVWLDSWEQDLINIINKPLY